MSKAEGEMSDVSINRRINLACKVNNKESH